MIERRVLGFTGSQERIRLAQSLGLDTLLALLKKELNFRELHHGDCVGGDALCHALALSHSYLIIVHPPDNPAKRAFVKLHKVLPELPYMRRNQEIVNAVDGLVACPSAREKASPHSGTWATVRRARKKGIRIWFVWPNGRVTEEAAKVPAETADKS